MRYLLLAMFVLIGIMLIISGCCGAASSAGGGSQGDTEANTLKSECEGILLQAGTSPFVSLIDNGWAHPSQNLGYYSIDSVGKCRKGSEAGENEDYTYCTGIYYKEVKKKDSAGTILSKYNMFYSVKAVYSEGSLMESGCTFLQKTDRTYID